MYVQIISEMVEAVGVMALVAVFYGQIIRNISPSVRRSMLTGLLFAAAGIVAMNSPVVLSPGMIIDGRAIFVGLGAALGGIPAAIVASVLTASFRWYLGGPGALTGCVGIFVVAIFGLVWARMLAGEMRPSPLQLAMGGAFLSLHFLAVYIAPLDVATMLMTTVYPVLLPASIVCTLVLGLLVEREYRLIDAEDQLTAEAQRDFLTGLSNRRSFFGDVQKIVAANPDNEKAVVVFDLDRFKQVNDKWGHAAGDAVLKHFATVLRRQSRSSDIVARTGGEEFTVFLPDCSVANARDFADRVITAMRKDRVALSEDVEISVTCSAGVSAYRSGKTSLDGAIAQADRALYVAKNRGRDGVAILDGQLA